MIPVFPGSRTSAPQKNPSHLAYVDIAISEAEHGYGMNQPELASVIKSYWLLVYICLGAT
jgi:hypothetical protein